MAKVRWRQWLKCPACGSPCGKPCTATITRGVPKGTPIGRPHPDRQRSAWAPPPRAPGCKGDPELYADRLTAWKRLAPRGVPVADIAHQLGMTRAALDQMVCRARRAGHPDAVYHLHGNAPGRRGVTRRRACADTI